MKKTTHVQTFKQQMAQSMAELSAIMNNGELPAGNGRLTIRTVEVTEPSVYDAKGVRKARESLNVSQAIFAKLIGVSDVLVRSWERGVRKPAPIARRLLDQILAYPVHFSALVRPAQALPGSSFGSMKHAPQRPIRRKSKPAK